MPDGWAVDMRTCVADCNSAGMCNTDYLIIPNANSNGESSIGTFHRFCGEEFNVFPTIESIPIVSCSTPFQIFFHSSADGNQGSDRGFALNYRQIPCGAD